jgi:Cutinase
MTVKRCVAACITVLCVIGVLQALPAAAATSATDPPRLTFPTGVACPLITVYASRGSGEAFDDSMLGAGAQLQPLYKYFIARYGSQNVGLEANGYPAAAVINPWTNTPDPYKLAHDYKPSLLRGVKDAVADIKAFASKCGTGIHRTLVIAGYSQGADVVRRAMAQIPSSSLSVYLDVQILLFGDPNFSPAEDYDAGGRVYEYGDYHQVVGSGRAFYKLGGLPAPPPLPQTYPLPLSWCHHNDPVCQLLGTSISRHEDYASRDAYSAVTQATLTDASWLIPRATAALGAGLQHRQVYIGFDYIPPIAGPHKGLPSKILFSAYVDGKFIGSRWVYSSGHLYATMPDKGWHTISIYALNHLIEEKRIQATW